jgi:type II secretory pathway pseudopilin PulG
MKLQNNKSTRGFTLIEITLVIALILGLIAVLVISIAAYKAGSDRAKCIMTITSVQKAVRSEVNMKELAATDEILLSDLVGTSGGPSEYFGQIPTCPAGGGYSSATVAPPIGTAYLICDLATTKGHAPKNLAGW